MKIIALRCQANPLNHKQPDIHLMTGSRGMLAAKQPLVVPMLLRLSHFRLSSYVVLVVSKQKGITLVFKTDPLQNVDINSTFDSISVIQKFIQREIEGQLRQMFREDLPGIIHRLSQQWVKAKVEAPYLSKRPLPTRRPLDTMSNPEIAIHRQFELGLGVHPQLSRQTLSTTIRSHRPRSVSGVSTVKSSTTANIAQSQSSPIEAQSPSHSDLENFDPTYGLRPEGLPTKSLFQGFRSLFIPNKGLADLAEESETSDADDYEDEEEGTSFDVVDWDETVSSFSPTPSVYNERDRDHDSTTEYETVPAVGGGTITRPRIYHSQSAIQVHPTLNPLSRSHPPHLRQMVAQNDSSLPTPTILSTTPSTAYLVDYHSGPIRMTGLHGPTINSAIALPRRPLSVPAGSSFATDRPTSPDSLKSQPSKSSSGPSRTLSTDPTDPALYEEKAFTSSTHYSTIATSGIYMRRPAAVRRMSVTSTTSAGNTATDLLSNSSPNNNQEYSGDSTGIPKIILPPTTKNNSIHQLSTLSHSNRTLSPYTRDLSHFTVRSVPPRNLRLNGLGIAGFGGVAGGDRQPVKARRKRMYHVGGQRTAPLSARKMPEKDDNITLRTSPSSPSEFDMSEMDRYFPLDEYEGIGSKSQNPAGRSTDKNHRRSYVYSSVNGSFSSPEVL